MNEPDPALSEAWQLFEQRVSDPLAVASLFIDLVQSHQDNPESFCTERMQFLDNAALLHAYRLEYIYCLSQQPEKREHIQSILLLIQAEQIRRGSPVHEKSPSQKKLGMHQDIMDLYLRACQAFDQKELKASSALLEQGLEKCSAIIHMEPSDYLRKDLQNYRVDALILLGDIHKNSGRIAESEQIYQDAMQYALSSSDSGSIAYARNRLSDSYRKSLQYDKALEILLPLRMELAPNTIEFVEAQLNLASLYQNARDHFETSNALHNAEIQLVQMGFMTPCAQHEGAFVPSWIKTVHTLTWPAGGFDAMFFKIATMHMQIQALREMISNTETDKNQALSCMEGIKRVISEAYDRISTVIARDQQMQSKIPIGTSVPTGFDMRARLDESSRIKQRADEFIAKFTDDTFNDEDFTNSDQFLSELDINTDSGFYYAILLTQGDALLRRNREGEAFQKWNGGLELSKKQGQHENAIDFLGRLLSAPGVLADFKSVLRLATEAIEIIESYRYQVSTAYLQSSFLTNKIQFYSLAVFAAWKLNDYQTMLRIADLTKGWASLKSFNVISSNEAPLQYKALQHELQHTTQELSTNANAEMQAELLSKRRILWDRLSLLKSSHTEHIDALDLPALQNSMSRDQVILHYYWLGEKVLLVTCISKNDVQVSRQIMDDEAYQQLMDYATNMRGVAGARSAESLVRGIVIPEKRAVRSRLELVAQYLLPVEIQQVLAGKKRLWISPHRILHSVPFHALHIGDHFVAEKYAISYIPNLGVFKKSLQRTIQESLLLVGTGHYHVKGVSLPDLPGVTEEIANIEAGYSNSNYIVHLLKGTSASLANIRALAESGDLSRHSLLHFALHGNDIPADVPMEDNLFLADGSLDGLEISTWDLNADLVILSACNSGERAVSGRGMSSFPGDEIFGLQASFFAAGARSVLGTLWPVDDKAATQIMTMFHQHFLDVADPAIALQLSVKQYLTSASEREREMFYWAPFFVVERITSTSANSSASGV